MTPEAARQAGFFDALLGRPDQCWDYAPAWVASPTSAFYAYLDGYALGVAALADTPTKEG